MRKYRYLVIGAGGVGPAIAWWLAQQEDTRFIIIADVSAERAREAARKIQKTAPQVPVSILGSDALTLNLEFGEFDAIVSAIPAEYSPQLAVMAIAAGIPFSDLGGVLSVSQKMRSGLREHATRERVPIMIDTGLMPGLGNMIAQDKLNSLSGVDSIKIEVCGLPQNPKPPLYHQRTFSIPGMLEIMEEAPILRNGRIRMVQPFDTIRNIKIPYLKRFSKMGNAQTCITAGAGTAAWWFQKQGIQNFWEETPRWNWDIIRGALVATPENERVQKLQELLPSTDGDHPDLVWMRVTVKKGRLKSVTEIFDTYDHDLQFSAMARVTGFSAAAVARILAQGSIPPGVHAPEEMAPEVLRRCLEDIGRPIPTPQK